MEKWEINTEWAEKAKRDIKKNPHASQKWDKFETDVTSNPFYHHKHKRIAKLPSSSNYPKDTYRYRNDPLRVVYYPEKENRTIYPLAASSATDAPYKRRSKK